MIKATNLKKNTSYFWGIMNNNGDCLNCSSFPKSIFHCLDKNQVSKSISGNTVPLNFKKGQDIYKEGTSAKGVYCIQNGKAKIFKTCSSRNITISLVGNSDLIGYCGLSDNDNYINSARCLEDSQICFIPKKTFTNLMAIHPELQTAMFRYTCLQNQKLSDFIMELKCKNMLNRVASALVEMNRKFGVDENKCLNISMTRKEISELSGTTTESVIRILNGLKKEKVVTFVGNRIKVLDTNKLLSACQV